MITWQKEDSTVAKKYSHKAFYTMRYEIPGTAKTQAGPATMYLLDGPCKTQ